MGPGFFSMIFVVPKKSAGVLPIINLKALKQFLKPKHFKMESAESIRATLLPGMWTYGIDLKEAYFHIPIHPESRRFLRVFFRGESYQFLLVSARLPGSLPWWPGSSPLTSTPPYTNFWTIDWAGPGPEIVVPNTGT